MMFVDVYPPLRVADVTLRTRRAWKHVQHEKLELRVFQRHEVRRRHFAAQSPFFPLDAAETVPRHALCGP